MTVPTRIDSIYSSDFRLRWFWILFDVRRLWTRLLSVCREWNTSCTSRSSTRCCSPSNRNSRDDWRSAWRSSTGSCWRTCEYSLQTKRDQRRGNGCVFDRICRKKCYIQRYNLRFLLNTVFTVLWLNITTLGTACMLDVHQRLISSNKLLRLLVQTGGDSR